MKQDQKTLKVINKDNPLWFYIYKDCELIGYSMAMQQVKSIVNLLKLYWIVETRKFKEADLLVVLTGHTQKYLQIRLFTQTTRGINNFEIPIGEWLVNNTIPGGEVSFYTFMSFLNPSSSLPE